MFTVYILQSTKRGRFYVGHTANLANRLQRHNLGLTQSGRTHGPWSVVYQESFSSRSEAVRRERQIKKWKSHKYLEEFIRKATPK